MRGSANGLLRGIEGVHQGLNWTSAKLLAQFIGSLEIRIREKKKAIAHLRAEGVGAPRVWCARLRCMPHSKITFDPCARRETFIALARLLRFVCSTYYAREYVPPPCALRSMNARDNPLPLGGRGKVRTIKVLQGWFVLELVGNCLAIPAVSVSANFSMWT
jgi:hypothetical protein